MACYALHTDAAHNGEPARYTIRRYANEYRRRLDLDSFKTGQDIAGHYIARGEIVPAYLPTRFETLEPVSGWAARKIIAAAVAVFRPFDSEFRFIRSWYADAAAYLY